MLNFFRRRDTAVRVVLGGMLLLVCAAMVLFLIPGWGSSSAATTPLSSQDVATVNGKTISGQELNLELQQQEQGRQLPPQLAPYFAQQILRNMILGVALADQAQQLGMTASNPEVVEMARIQNPELFPNGKYVGDQAAAPAISQAYQKTMAEYQDMLRQQVLDQKMYDLVTDGVRVDDADLQKEFQRENEKAKFDYVLLKPADLLSQVTVTPAGLEAYYKQNASKYMTPERRKLDVLLLNQAQIAAQIQVTDAQIEQYYQQNLATYTHPERVQVAHILLKTTGQDPADAAKTKAKAEDLLKQLKAGANFADLAKKNSQDDASAAQGGELGWIERGQTVPAFEQTAFSLPPGQISNVVQTEYGFHIIKVEAHETAHVQPLTEVHDQIKAQLQNDMAADRAQTIMSQAQALAAQTPLADVAKQLKLDYFSTEPIGRADPITGIGVNPDFANAAFSASSGGITPPVKVAAGFAIAKVVQVLPPGQQTLDQARDAVTADYKQQLAADLATSRAATLAQAAQKQGLKAAAASMHLILKTSDPVIRDGTVADIGSISDFADNLFSLKPGETGQPTTANGNQLVYSLVNLEEPSPDQFAQQRGALLEKMIEDERNAMFQTYTDSLVDSLSKAGKIKLNQDAIDRAVGTGSPTGGTGGI